jgi:hypothetical protein
MSRVKWSMGDAESKPQQPLRIDKDRTDLDRSLGRQKARFTCDYTPIFRQLLIRALDVFLIRGVDAEYVPSLDEDRYLYD